MEAKAASQNGHGRFCNVCSRAVILLIESETAEEMKHQSEGFRGNFKIFLKEVCSSFIIINIHG